MRFNLQYCRKRAGFKSARAFAEHMEMSLNTYNNYEQGMTKLSLERAWEFADALSCSIDELAGREWPHAGESSCAIARRQQLNQCYDLLDSKSQTDLLGIASSFSKDASRLASKPEDEVEDSADALKAAREQEDGSAK